jgi:uncharacterized protein (DUF1499 family)
MSAGTRNQYLYINSANRHSGNPYDFEIVIKPGLIKAANNETIRISLVQLSMPLTINQINNLNNTIQFTNTITNQTTTISITEGNWNVYDLANYVKKAYTGITSLTFDKSTNHYVFVFSQSHKMTFVDDANIVFGFSSKTTSTNTTLESNAPARPNMINDVILSVFDISPVSHNLDNFASSEMKLTNMIALIPTDDIPFGVVRYENINGEFQISIGEKEIKKLRFTVKDIDDRLLSYCNFPEYVMLLKIQYITSSDEQLQILKDMRDINRLAFVSNHLPS